MMGITGTTDMKLSYVIVTHNRREALLKTLAQLQRCTPLPKGAWETWVVDNASTDGTVQTLEADYPGVRLIRRKENEGAAARSYAFSPARGKYLILLDDDSYPVDDTVARSIQYMDQHPRTAALVGRVVLPDGTLEASALPAVMLSGAVCIRRSVVDQLGGFRAEFFRKAGEYDLSFRMWQAGYAVERFEDIVYRHDKVMTGRSSGLAHFMDLRNNLILVERFLPPLMRRAYRRDYLMRYAAIARKEKCESSITRALAEARQWAAHERSTGRQTLDPAVLETLFEWKQQRCAVSRWAATHGIRSVVIADYGKNLYATFRAAQLASLDIRSIADSGPAFAGLRYRRVPILPHAAALAAAPDGVIVSNINPAQIDRAAAQVRAHFAGPMLRLWRPRTLAQLEQDPPAMLSA
jgi:GT2 family glycosyltransferase